MMYWVIFRVTDDMGYFDEEDKIELPQKEFHRIFEDAWKHEVVGCASWQKK